MCSPCIFRSVKDDDQAVRIAVQADVAVVQIVSAERASALVRTLKERNPTIEVVLFEPNAQPDTAGALVAKTGAGYLITSLDALPQLVEDIRRGTDRV
jgi:hypothetical protein